MRIFISGGCKNGKSSHAQRLAKMMNNDRPLYYLATMIPKDAEDDARVLAHRKEREGWGFETVLVPGNLTRALEGCDPGGSFLLDSVTALLENAMFGESGADVNAHIPLAEELAQAAARLRNIVIVSDFLYSDAVIYEGLVERYRRNLAYIDRRLAAVCDIVLEGACGGVVAHKGRGLYEGLCHAV